MAVWLLVVATSGWCCHRPCGCSAAPIAASKPAKHVRNCKCCRCSRQPAPQASAACPCKHDCQGVCVYLTSSKVQIDAGWILSLFASPDVSLPNAALSQAELLSREQLHWLCQLSPPSQGDPAPQILLI